MAELSFVLPGAREERERAVAELRALAAEAAGGDRGVAELVGRLADAVEQDRREEVRAYASAIPPRAVAEGTTFRHRSIWGVAEVVRGALVLLPIAVTWYGLSAASAAYGSLLEARPDLIAEPFLLLWQHGFVGTTPLTFSVLAAVDGFLISLIIVLSLVIHYRADVHDPRQRARTLLKESQVRGTLARALSLAGSGPAAAAVADDAGRPVPSTATQLELAGLERSVDEIRQGLLQLGSFAEATYRAADRGAVAQEAQLERLGQLAERQSGLTGALEEIAARMASIPGPAQLGPNGVARLAINTTMEEQDQLLKEIERLLDGLQQVKKAQQVTAGSVTLQTDALQYLAKALVLASERVQEASQALGDAAAPGFIARQMQPRRLFLAGGVAVLALALVGGAAVAAPRLLEPPAQRYARDLRVQSQGFVGFQQMRFVLPPPRSASNDTQVRDAAVSLEDAAVRAEQWLDVHAAPAEASGLAASLRGVTGAARRTASGTLAWLNARPADARNADEGVPASVLADLTYGDALFRDFNVQLGLVR